VDIRMHIRPLRVSALVAVAVCVLSACASTAPSDAEKHAPEIKIYQLGDPNASRFEVVNRLWADSWRTAYGLPTYPTQEQAIAALQTEAALRGADGLLNVVCLDQGRPNWWSKSEPAILCYGIAVRARPSGG